MNPESCNSCGLWVQLACIWEATARKPGNVHRFRDAADTHYVDFLTAAAAIAPILDNAAPHSDSFDIARWCFTCSSRIHSE